MRLADICDAQRTLEDARKRPVTANHLLSEMGYFELYPDSSLDEMNNTDGMPVNTFSLMFEVEEENVVEGLFGIAVTLRYADGQKRVFDLSEIGEVPALVESYMFTLTDPEDKDIEDDFDFGFGGDD
ncbi:hypothetical protein [Mitsuokella sp.]|uniref:hypothetical protein n=1 Tax=Mitsuokella sp. TaxID=2049034 RepID=UPI003D7E5729